MLSIVAGLALSVMPLDFSPPPKPSAFDAFGRAAQRLYTEEFRRLTQPRTQPRPMPPADPDDNGTTPGQGQPPPTPPQPTRPAQPTTQPVVPPMPPAIDEEGGIPPEPIPPPFRQPQFNLPVPPSPPAVPAINGYWRPTQYGWRWVTLPPGFPPPPPNFNVPPPLPVEYILPYYHYYRWLYGDPFYGRNHGGFFRTNDGLRFPSEFYRYRRGYYDLPPIPFWPR